MYRRTMWCQGVGSVALALMLVLALPGLTLAGGVAVILDAMPADVQAGKMFSVGFMIRSAHEDQTPQPDLTPAVIATNTATHEKVTATGHPEGKLGHYVAGLILPSTGEWHWKIFPFGASEEFATTTQSPIVVGGAAPAGAKATDVGADVKAHSNAFIPAALTIAAGTAVAWHIGDIAHTVTAVDGAFASGGVEPGAMYTHTFATSGTYAYVCEYHPGMKGVVVVTEAAPPAQPDPQLANVAASQPAAPEAAAPTNAQTLPATGQAVSPFRAPLAGLAVALALAGLSLALRRPRVS